MSERILFVVTWWLTACGAAPAPAVAPPPSTSTVAATTARTTEDAKPALFAFHSGGWTNLHHRLHHQATARRPPPAAAPPSPEHESWQAAVGYYRERFGKTGGFGVVFDEELIAVHRRLTMLDFDDQPTMLTGEHRRHLVAVKELDRDGWPEQDAMNRAWIAALEPRLAEHGEAYVAALTALYGVAWPPRPIRVDVSCRAGPVGAYTVDDPVHITISSCDPAYAGDGALEMIFHEASHALVGPIEDKIDAAAAALDQQAPRSLWHAVLFYTAGELTRRQLGRDYVPYAQRRALWGGPMGSRAPLEAEWQPYLDGERGLDAAITALVAASLRD
jgi:hypothetical protein